MKLSRLIPICLISLMAGQILPRLFTTLPNLLLAAAAYLLVIYAVDSFLAPRKD